MLDSLLGRRAPSPVTAADQRQIGLEELLDLRGQVAAINKSQAVIEFNLDGTIIYANDNFLQAVGYSLAEVQGQHHRMFVDAEHARSAEYRQFWAELNSGRFSSGEYRRVAKGGRELWLHATYNPILDEQGKPFRVVKYASDITAMKLRAADFEGQLSAISKSQAVIEFELDGTIRTANDNFLQATGYRLDEIRGKQHRIFVDPAEARGSDYATFWADLRSGEFQSGEFRRIGKGGREFWIQATYNPILDPSGNPFKVVKYAVDITARKQQEQEVLELAERVGIAAQRVSGVAEQMSQRAGQTSEEAGTVSTASEQIAANVQTVASGSEEMTASIKEIAQSASEAARVAAQAVVTADQADQTIAKLGTSSVEIGQVVKTITAIAQQTNLLALNATIEAARAGEAGKGFAVVANEVKELAKATASATEDIGRRIGAIQHDSESAVEAIREVGAIISRISDIQTSIAGAVEEQTATTNEMSRNVSEAARGSAEIMHSIGSVAAGAQETVNSAAETRAAADELVAIADAMRGVTLQHA